MAMLVRRPRHVEPDCLIEFFFYEDVDFFFKLFHFLLQFIIFLSVYSLCSLMNVRSCVVIYRYGW